MYESPFDEHLEYLQSDNRQFRISNPTTLEVLVKKHYGLFDGCELEGKALLDLGACVGATGEWALHNGAAAYTGVEAQKEYAQAARTNLERHGTKAHISDEPIEFYLKHCDEQYDYVLILGVLHVFFNFVEVLAQAVAKSRDYVIIENLCPAGKGSIVEFNNSQKINLAGSNHESMEGLGVRISEAALDLVLSTHGFERERKVKVAKITGSLDVYNDTLLEESRYIVRYRRSNVRRAVLSQDLSIGQQGSKIPWHQGKEPWVFNEKVADNFNDIARNNIPNYKSVIEKCVTLAKAMCHYDAKIIDVGSALGYTLEKLHAGGFSQLYGVDSAISMIDKSWCNEKTVLLHSEFFPVHLAKFQLVIVNWTLHFIKAREAYLRDIYEALEMGGGLILSEKVTSSEVVKDLYYDFKKSRGISLEEIGQKEAALQGVLITQPVSWYLDVLTKIGFREVDIVDASYSFVTFLAKK